MIDKGGSPALRADLADDVRAIARLGGIPSLLRLVCENTGMGFAAIARVTDDAWVACAVDDRIDFGLGPGGQLDISTTLCREVRAQREPLVVPSVSNDPALRDHITPRIYGLESYVSLPIVRADGSYFGNLCAIDTRPAPALANPETLASLRAFAQLIAMQLDAEDQRDHAEAALAVERATAELREHFVAVLGHDLRNPLHAVVAMSELLQRRRDAEPRAAEVGQRLRTIAGRMSALIDDVLDLARTRLGSNIGTELARRIDLAARLTDVVEEARLGRPDRAIVAAIEIDAPVRCDAGRLQQLLSNLLGNALTHGAPDRPIEVDARIDDDTLEIAVANAGEPIVPENLGKVFEPYWRSPQSAAGGGLGLGLYICAQIARAHGGTIVARSSAEDGTRFTLRVPVDGPGGDVPTVTSIR